MNLEKICRICLTTKRDMRNLFSENILQMLENFSQIKICKDDGWPSLICSQCVHQISRCYSFKMRIEKSDKQLKQYIRSLIVEESPKELKATQPFMQEIQIQTPRPEPQIQQATSTTPLIIATAMLNSNQQLIQTANGQIFLPGPNNTIQMIATNPPQPQLQQLLQIRPEQDNRLATELIVQPEIAETSHHQYYEEIPVYVQSTNGQQTILNLPHHQIQALEQQIHQSNKECSNASSDTDEIEIQNFDDEEYACEDLEEVIDAEQDLTTETTTSTTYYVEQESLAEGSNEDTIDKKLLATFLSQHSIQKGPSKFCCNLCQNEFKSMKWLESHMKSIHSNFLKANCKKQPTCEICFKSFRGEGMLRMHMKTHERENKNPTCSVCGKEFKSKSILYRHRATHFCDQKHTCSICNKTFNTNYQLNAHLARHKNHRCSECDKYFNNAIELKSHHQQEHSDGCEKSSTCAKNS